MAPVAAVDYRYQLTRDGELVATGRLHRDAPMQVGDRLEIAGQVGIVRSVGPVLGEDEFCLVVHVVRQ